MARFKIFRKDRVATWQWECQESCLDGESTETLWVRIGKQTSLGDTALSTNCCRLPDQEEVKDEAFILVLGTCPG